MEVMNTLHEYLREVIREIRWYEQMHALVLDRHKKQINRLVEAILSTSDELQKELGEKTNVETTKKNH